jgi:PAS domain S-box-containing protein
MISPSAASARRRFSAGLVLVPVLCLVFGALLLEPVPEATRQLASGVGLLTGGLLVVVSGSMVARRSVGARRRSWQLLTAAAVTACLGNVWVAVVGADPVASPSVVGEASIALALLLSIAGLLSFPALRHRGLELVRIMLDGLVVGSAVLTITALLDYERVFHLDETSPVLRFTSVLFPLLDMVLATVALLLVVRSRTDRVVLGLVGAGFVMYAAADLAFAVRAAEGTFAFGTPLDLVWIAGYLLIALAAWHPSAPGRSTPEVRSGGSDVQSTVIVVGVIGAALAAQALFGADGPMGRVQQLLWLLLVLATGLRQVLLTIDNAALRRGLERRVGEQTADLRRLVRDNELLLSSVGDGIYGVDAQGRVTFVNPSGAATLGYRPDQLLGHDAHAHFHAPRPDGRPYEAALCYVTEAIEQGLTSAAEEDLYLRRDGEAFPVEITASPLVDDGHISGAVVVFRDMTQRREVERMKNEFLSVVSHELRTPLTSIRGSLGLLAGGGLVELNAQASRMVSIALESSERLTRLINDILDIERLESGSLPMDLQPREAAELVLASVQELTGLARSQGVLLEAGPTSGRVLADADRIVQTLANLVSNAIKFSPAEALVRVEAQTEQAPGGATVTFSVRDQGRGIPEDKLESIFERFEQVDSSDARQMGGTGLGLAISRSIVERHGGRIWAESAVGEGTTVFFTLPALEDAPYVDRRGDADAPLVVVCDSDHAVVEGVSAMLSRHGYRTVGVDNPRSVLHHAAVEPPAAVLLDLAMWQTSGSELGSRLRLHEATAMIPLLVIAGLAPDSREFAGSVEQWSVSQVREDRLVAAVAHGAQGRRRDVRVLVVDDDVVLGRIIAGLIAGHGLEVAHASNVEEAVEAAVRLEPRAVVLNLLLPDGDGADLVAQLRQRRMLESASLVAYSPQTTPGGATAAGQQPTSTEDLETHVLRLLDAVTGRKAVHHHDPAGLGADR